jgi:hypothetical protein
MKISQAIRLEHVGDLELDAEAGMRQKSEESAASGNRVHLPLTDSAFGRRAQEPLASRALMASLAAASAPSCMAFASGAFRVSKSLPL